ncbi:winged helix-turn-helix transcriptional regulator [Oryzifoliimicrobium ureilyticus]|uniref:winged helix-turn-helix transcriptional regulator n=1 Tax=Oryzifoliimicrobium ureilyticus TaxID=3113724 RepID=UPI00307659F9
MKVKSFSGMRCSMAGALEVIGDRWALLLVRDLALGIHRYDALRTTTGIPAATLATRLKQLTESGLVKRVRYQERPPRDEYHLTEKGRDLWKVTLALREWGDRWDASGFGVPMETVDRANGHLVSLALVDCETGATVPVERAALRPGPDADNTVRRLLSGVDIQAQ